jgi:hypothetical protein
MNRKYLWAPLALGLALVTTASYAAGRDDRQHFAIADAMATADAQSKLDGSVKFYWGKQSAPGVGKKFGTYTANKKTSFLGKSDLAGCQRAWLSAMITFQERAQQLGGNAVINLHSVYKNEDFVSETEFECGAGTVMGGVALRGDIVRIGK